MTTRLVILDYQGIGNVITSLPFVARAQEAFGSANVAVLCRGHARSFLEAAGIRKVCVVGGLGQLIATVVALRVGGFTHVLGTPPVSREKVRWLAAVSGLAPVQPSDPVPLYGARHISEAFQQLADLLGLGILLKPRLPAEWPTSSVAPRLLSAWEWWTSGPRRLAIHLGTEAGNAYRRWDVGNFATCVNTVSREVPGLRSLILGTESDLSVAFRCRISERVEVLDLTGRAPIEESARFLRGADAIVSNDSGLMHLAVALDVPTFAVFGPSSPQFMFPKNHAGRFFQSLACGGPCYPHVDRRCVKSRCVDRVSPNEVARALIAHLGGSSRNAPGISPISFDARSPAGIEGSLGAR